ncbi:MAG: hypothetical protein WC775_04650 [Patescibacteria group bacterium]
MVVLSVTLLGGSAQTVSAASAGPNSNLTAVANTTEYTPAVSFIRMTGVISASLLDSSGVQTATVVGANARCAWSADDQWNVCPVPQTGNLPLLVAYNTNTGVTVSLGLTGTKPVFSGTILVYQSQVAWGWNQNQIYTSNVTFEGGTPITTTRVQVTDAMWSGAFDPAIDPTTGRLCVTQEYVFNNIDIRCQVQDGTWATVSDQNVVGSHTSPTFSPDGHLLFASDGKIYSQTITGTAAAIALGYYPNCVNYWCVWTTSAPAAELVLLDTRMGLTSTIATNSVTFSGPMLSHGEYHVPQPITQVIAVADAGPHAQQVPVTVTFSATVLPEQADVSYTWHLPHNTVLSGQDVTAVITAAGHLTAVVDACNRFGCKSGYAPFETYPNMWTYVHTDFSTTVATAGQSVPMWTTIYDQFMNLIVEGNSEWIAVTCSGHATCSKVAVTDTVAESVVITAGFGSLVTTNTVTFLPGPTVSVTWDLPSPIEAGQPVTATIKALDQYGNIVTSNIGDFDVTVPADCNVVGSILSCYTAGSHELSASYSNVTGTATVEVIWGLPGRIHGGFPSANWVYSSGSIQSYGEVFNQYGVLIIWPITWLADEGSGSFDDAGVLHAPVCLPGKMLTGTMTATGTSVSAPWALECRPPHTLFLPLALR